MSRAPVRDEGGNSPATNRNPLAAGLAAMALHALVAVMAGWPFPSTGTFLAGMLGIIATFRGRGFGVRAIAGLTTLVVLTPTILPWPILTAGLAALLTRRLPAPRDPVSNLAVALPALTALVVALTA